MGCGEVSGVCSPGDEGDGPGNEEEEEDGVHDDDDELVGGQEFHDGLPVFFALGAEFVFGALSGAEEADGGEVADGVEVGDGEGGALGAGVAGDFAEVAEEEPDGGGYEGEDEEDECACYPVEGGDVEQDDGGGGDGGEGCAPVDLSVFGDSFDAVCHEGDVPGRWCLLGGEGGCEEAAEEAFSEFFLFEAGLVGAVGDFGVGAGYCPGGSKTDKEPDEEVVEAFFGAEGFC